MRVANILSGLMAVAFLIAGCQSQPVPKTTGPVTAADVVIYKEAPAKEFTDLGPVTLPTDEATWEQRGDSTLGFQLLREKVAAMGGNAILLAVNESEYDMVVMAGDKGKYYQVPLRRNPRVAVVRALWVQPWERPRLRK